MWSKTTNQKNLSNVVYIQLSQPHKKMVMNRIQGIRFLPSTEDVFSKTIRESSTITRILKMPQDLDQNMIFPLVLRKLGNENEIALYTNAFVMSKSLKKIKTFD